MAIVQLTAANLTDAQANPTRVCFLNGAQIYLTRFAGDWVIGQAVQGGAPGVVVPDGSGNYPGLGLQDVDTSHMIVRVAALKNGSFVPVTGTALDILNFSQQPNFDHWCPCNNVAAPSPEAVFNKV